MSANPSYLPSRLSEAITVSRCGDLVNQLNALEAEPSAKRFANTRGQRRQLALDLVNEAQKLVDALADAPVQRKARVAKPAKPTPELTNWVQEAQKTFRNDAPPRPDNKPSEVTCATKPVEATA